MNNKYNSQRGMADGAALSIFLMVAALLVMGLIVGGCWAVPKYNVWQQGMAGEAELARADQNRRIAVQEAQAKMDAASLLAQAEVERAKGVAQANKIIGESLQHNEAYLRWLWINNLEHGEHQVIYIPTEAGLPILEAGKR